MKKLLKDIGEVRGNNILIVGYGREGKSVHRYLRAKYPDAIVSIADQKLITPLFPVEDVFTGEEWLSSLHRFQTVVRAPGVSEMLPQLVAYKKAGGFITSTTNIFFSRKPTMVIGVTGTKGKSTTASLVAHILSRAYPDVRVIGNIGAPALDYIEDETKKTIYVYELSSHQLSDVRYSPQVVIILPVVSEHLDYYGSFEKYYEAKAHIVSFQTKKDTVIYNEDSITAKQIAQRSLARKVAYNTRSSETFPHTPLLGNKENIRAAFTCCAVFSLSRDDMEKGLETFVPLPHRLEFVGEYKGIRFYNDSLATIPEATIHAIRSLGDTTETLIAGGFDRGVSIDALGEFLSTSSIKTVIVMGQTGKKIIASLKMHTAHAIRVIEAASMEEAVRIAYTKTAIGKICVLSPAATSFDQFKDYKDRGEQFARWVVQVAQE